MEGTQRKKEGGGDGVEGREGNKERETMGEERETRTIKLPENEN